MDEQLKEGLLKVRVTKDEITGKGHIWIDIDDIIVWLKKEGYAVVKIHHFTCNCKYCRKEGE